MAILTAKWCFERSLLICLLLISPLHAQDKELCRRIENHLLIRDISTAAAEADEAVAAYPESLNVQEMALKAFSQAGQEDKALQAFYRWQTLAQKKDPPLKTPRHLYEELAWGIIQKGEKSASPAIRTISMLAAFWGQDARGLKIIERRLSDPNSLVRQTAAEMAAKLQDEPIKKAVVKRLGEETDWAVRLELLRAVGRMKIKEMKPQLLEILAEPKTTLEEKAAATESLLDLLETMPRSELETLSRSDRASLRALSAEIITFLQEKQPIDILQQLARDERSEVRGQAVLGLGVLRQDPDSTVKDLLKDRALSVQLAAAYVILLSGSQEADDWISHALATEKPEQARIIASMLVSAGSYGKALAKTELRKATDFYVKMNLSLAVMDEEALDILYQGVTQNADRWSREQKGVFRPLVLSKEIHHPLIPNYPEIVNKKTRLEILNLLALKEHPHALKAVREFLREKGWGVAGLTSVLLLTEGDDAAAEMVSALLHDPDENIRLQAALILPCWDEGEDTGSILIQNYETLSREKKEIVLEALGKLGTDQAIAFLVREMGSPHATMRLIASASLLKCLYD